MSKGIERKTVVENNIDGYLYVKVVSAKYPNGGPPTYDICLGTRPPARERIRWVYLGMRATKELAIAAAEDLRQDLMKLRRVKAY